MEISVQHKLEAGHGNRCGELQRRLHRRSMKGICRRGRLPRSRRGKHRHDDSHRACEADRCHPAFQTRLRPCAAPHPLNNAGACRISRSKHSAAARKLWASVSILSAATAAPRFTGCSRCRNRGRRPGRAPWSGRCRPACRGDSARRFIASCTKRRGVRRHATTMATASAARAQQHGIRHAHDRRRVDDDQIIVPPRFSHDHLQRIGVEIGRDPAHIARCGQIIEPAQAVGLDAFAPLIGFLQEHRQTRLGRTRQGVFQARSPEIALDQQGLAAVAGSEPGQCEGEAGLALTRQDGGDEQRLERRPVGRPAQLRAERPAGSRPSASPAGR